MSRADDDEAYLCELADAGLPPRGGAPAERFGDFVLEERLGQGGMGVVWRARQVSLDRAVALKLVRPDALLFDGARERFRREVETVARLQHPGIVPVLASGEERGVPYYAMPLVRGVTLAEVVQAVRGRDPASLSGADLFDALPSEHRGAARPPLFDGSWSDACVRIAGEVAAALEHARRRGVVHRDVKPSNVMVTCSGRVLLLDFGLARVASDARLTRTGAAAGSLAYLAPERVTGAGERGRDAGRDDPRQDVYALGVTLYELLALAPPYRDVEGRGLVAAVLAGDVVPLRTRNRGVPVELQALVGAAMERDPRRRYADAGALARDLANVLARRPLEARAPGPTLRLRRWVQRRPLAAALLAAGVVVPGLLLAQALRHAARVQDRNEEIARRADRLSDLGAELTASLTEASAEERRAADGLRKAMEAVDRMMVRVGDETLVGVPGLEGVRRQLLAEALQFQEWFLAAGGDEPDLALRAAQVALGAARVHGWTNRLGDALAMLERAEQLLRGLGPPEAATGAARALWVELLAARHRAETLTGRYRESDVTAARLEALGRAGGDDAGAAAVRCRVRVDRARRLQATGDLDAAEALLVAAIAALPPVDAGDAPDGDGRRAALLEAAAHAQENLAALLDLRAEGAGTGDGADAATDRARALAAAERAARLGERLLASDPDSAQARARAARTSGVLGVMLHRGGRSEPALARFDRAVRLLQDLVADHPGVVAYRGDLAEQLTNAGGALHALGRVEAAVERMRAGAAAYDAYFERGGADVGAYAARAGTLYNLGVLREQAGELPSALDAYDRALESLDQALRRAPEHAAARLYADAFLRQVLPTYAALDEHERLVAHVRVYAARATGGAELLELLDALASWIEAAEVWAADDPATLERVVAGTAVSAAAVIAGALEAAVLTRAQVERRPRASALLELEAVRAVLGRRD